jgi:hypothetical protein
MRATAICTSDKVGGEKLDIILGYSIHCNDNHIIMMPPPKNKKKNVFLGVSIKGRFIATYNVTNYLLKIIIIIKRDELGS